jgi:hypothetical protein
MLPMTTAKLAIKNSDPTAYFRASGVSHRTGRTIASRRPATADVRSAAHLPQKQIQRFKCKPRSRRRSTLPKRARFRCWFCPRRQFPERSLQISPPDHVLRQISRQQLAAEEVCPPPPPATMAIDVSRQRTRSIRAQQYLTIHSLLNNAFVRANLQVPVPRQESRHDAQRPCATTDN